MMTGQFTESQKPTKEELECACDDGAAAAKDALASSSTPIFLSDEGTFNELQNARAIGWNSIYATEENLKRFSPKPLREKLLAAGSPNQ